MGDDTDYLAQFRKNTPARKDKKEKKKSRRNPTISTFIHIEIARDLDLRIKQRVIKKG